jgi:PTH1 family peptidyl-tRNA hydrolase
MDCNNVPMACGVDQSPNAGADLPHGKFSRSDRSYRNSSPQRTNSCHLQHSSNGAGRRNSDRKILEEEDPEPRRARETDDEEGGPAASRDPTQIMATVPVFKSPYRFLFIASVGNLAAPYTLTRHSAGHSLLGALEPLLEDRIGLTTSPITSPSRGPRGSSLFYQTWKCPALMNVSGPPTVRQLKTWMADRQRVFQKIAPTPSATATASSSSAAPTLRLLRAGAEEIDLDVRDLTHFRPTLVLLHDELEAAPGQIKIRRGGPQQASLRGHRGLISVMESLRGSGLLGTSTAKKDTTAPSASPLAILRVGIGIGRPSSRERDAVADYVLTKMSPSDLKAVQDAAPRVVESLVQEMYRRDEE